jgi:hypothetical protein
MDDLSHWHKEDSRAHGRYEEVADSKIDAAHHLSLIFEGYIKTKSVTGTNARAVALNNCVKIIVDESNNIAVDSACIFANSLM